MESDFFEYCYEQGNCESGTGWSGTFAFNAGFMILNTINICVLTCGSFFWWPRYCGSLFNCCYCCCTYAGMVFTLAVRFNPMGEMCAINIAPSTWDGAFWKDDTTY